MAETIYRKDFDIPTAVGDDGFVGGIPEDATVADYKFPNLLFFAENAFENIDFQIWQRHKTASVANPATTTFTADRMAVIFDVDSGTPPTTLTHARDIDGYKITTTGAGSGYGTNSFYYVRQRILAATRTMADGKYITVAFTASGQVGKKLGLSFVQNYGSGGSPTSAETINGGYVTLTATATRYQVTIQTNTLTAKTFGTDDENNYIEVRFYHQWGATQASLVGDTIAEDWDSAGSIYLNNIDVHNNTSAGVIRPFVPRRDDMSRCREWCEVWRVESGETYCALCDGRANTTTKASGVLHFDSKKFVPSMDYTADILFYRSTEYVGTAAAIFHESSKSVFLSVTVSGVTVDWVGTIYLKGASAELIIDSEI